MNTFAKFVMAPAAVVVVAAAGINLLPAGSGVGGGPAVQSSSSPSPQPPLSPAAFAFPPAGDLAIGRHDLTIDGVSFSLEVPTSGWVSNGSFGIDHGRYPATWVGGFIFWSDSPDGVFADPCAGEQGPRVGPSAADLADAVANVPGTDATGPSDVTVGGFPAKLVVVKIPEDAGCTAENFYLWWDQRLTGRYATELGSTIRVWIVDVDGTIVWIDGETSKGASPEIQRQVQQIVDSIQFE